MKAYLASLSERVSESQHLIQPFHVVSWPEDQLSISLGFSVPRRTHSVLCLEILGSWRSFDVGRQILPKAWMGCQSNPPASDWSETYFHYIPQSSSQHHYPGYSFLMLGHFLGDEMFILNISLIYITLPIWDVHGLFLLNIPKLPASKWWR